MILLLIIIILFAAFYFWERKAGVDTESIQSSFASDRSEALALIHKLMQHHRISAEEIASYAPETSSVVNELRSRLSQRSDDSASTFFAALGAVLIVAGLGTSIMGFWDTMGSLMRVLSTLGLGLAMEAVMVMLLKNNRYPVITRPLIVFAPFVEVLGWFVLLDEYFPALGRAVFAPSAVFGIMAVQYGVIFLAGVKQRSTLIYLLLFAGLFIAFAAQSLGIDSRYTATGLGAVLLLVSYLLSKTSYADLSDLGYLIGCTAFSTGVALITEELSNGSWAASVTGGSIMALAVGLRISGGSKTENLYWLSGTALLYGGLFGLLQGSTVELGYLIVAVGMMYLSKYLESKTVLLTSSLALLWFLGYLSSKYFVASLGWPFVLILLGASLYGVSLFAMNLKSQFRPH